MTSDRPRSASIRSAEEHRSQFQWRARRREGVSLADGGAFRHGRHDFVADQQCRHHPGIHREPIAFELEDGDERSKSRGGSPHDYGADGEPESVLSFARFVAPAEAEKRP